MGNEPNARCISCTSDPDLFETTHWKVSLAPDQRYLGRSFVVLQRHAATLSDLTTEELLDWHHVVQIMEHTWNRALGATKLDWSCYMNLAYQFDPPNPHVHWHARPRYDKVQRVGGITFDDNEFGNHYSREEVRTVEAYVLQDIRSRIRDWLPEEVSA